MKIAKLSKIAGGRTYEKVFAVNEEKFAVTFAVSKLKGTTLTAFFCRFTAFFCRFTAFLCRFTANLGFTADRKKRVYKYI